MVNQNNNSWSLPKGQVEKGENELTAAKREIHEEAGIEEKNLELIKGGSRHNTQIEQELKRQAKEVGILQERVTLLEAENTLLKELLERECVSSVSGYLKRNP